MDILYAFGGLLLILAGMTGAAAAIRIARDPHGLYERNRRAALAARRYTRGEINREELESQPGLLKTGLCHAVDGEGKVSFRQTARLSRGALHK